MPLPGQMGKRQDSNLGSLAPVKEFFLRHDHNGVEQDFR